MVRSGIKSLRFLRTWPNDIVFKIMAPQGEGTSFTYHCSVMRSAAAGRNASFRKEKTNINTSQVLAKGHSLCKTFSLSTFPFQKNCIICVIKRGEAATFHLGTPLPPGTLVAAPKVLLGVPGSSSNVVSAGRCIRSCGRILQRSLPYCPGQFLLLTAIYQSRSWRKKCLDKFL